MGRGQEEDQDQMKLDWIIEDTVDLRNSSTPTGVATSEVWTCLMAENQKKLDEAIDWLYKLVALAKLKFLLRRGLLPKFLLP